MLNKTLIQLVEKKDLSETQAEEVVQALITPGIHPALIGAILASLKTKGESPQEISGFVKGLKKAAVGIPQGKEPLYDVAGTGGDHAQTANISTLAAFVLAGAGVKIAKHGNRSVSSRCGSADVLHQLGVNIHASPLNIAEQIEVAGVGFIYAPLVHPAMKHVMESRKALGTPSIFNLAGPLANPMSLSGQLVGVYKPELLEPIAQTLLQLGVQTGAVIHGHGGLDEGSLSGRNEVLLLQEGRYHRVGIDATDFGFKRANGDALRGGSIAENARIFVSVLQGDQSPVADAVCFNAAIALTAFGVCGRFEDGVQLALDSLESGRAFKAFETLREISLRKEEPLCS